LIEPRPCRRRKNRQQDLEISTPEVSVTAPDAAITPAILSFLSEFVEKAHTDTAKLPLEKYVQEMEEHCVWMAKGKYSLATVRAKLFDVVLQVQQKALCHRSASCDCRSSIPT
jgi:hypothetical protein